MIYKFKSKAAGDVIMMGPNGDQVLRLIGKEPAATGIIEVAHMPAALAALEQAVANEDATRKQAELEASDSKAGGKSSDTPARDHVSMRQRVWPLVEMLRRSHSEAADIVWGV
jgi:Domain of unknown function (DUF1840)